MNPMKKMKQAMVKMSVGSAASKVRFVGWRKFSRNWGKWVENLHSAHQSTWKNAGIYDAIMASKYHISRHDDLILELVSRWCSETNTFIFPWGEATITLEDLMVLGGFSALGVTTLNPPENEAKLLKIEEQLDLARREVQRGKSNKAAQGQWLKKFMGSKSDIEHEAFLAFWLSRFVFPTGSSEIIKRQVFPIAIQLSRGIRTALARPVLGMLYKDLTALNKRLMDMAFVSDTGNNVVQLFNLHAPFHLLQIWAWERLPSLKPITNCLFSSEEFPRAARRTKVNILKDRDLRSAIDFAEESFVWCPYGEFDKHRGREAYESFVQCIKTSKLEGFDCVEKYLPQRVARQFGLAQDIPTDHGDELTNQVTFNDGKLYGTSRLDKPNVTARYQQWWKLQRSPSNSSRVKMESGIDYGSPPGFPPRIQFITIDDDDGDVFRDDEATLPSAYPSNHVPVSQIESESPFSSSISDNESIEDVEYSIESAMAGEHPSLNVKANGDQQGRGVLGLTCQVITIDNSSEDDDNTENAFGQPKISKLGHSRDMEARTGLMDSMNKPKERLIEDACKCRGSNHGDSRDGTEAKGDTRGFHEFVPSNEVAMNLDAESFTNGRTKDKDLNLEARISRLEKIVFCTHIVGA